MARAYRSTLEFLGAVNAQYIGGLTTRSIHLFVCAAMLCGVASAPAALVCLDLGFEFSGASAPVGTAPWLRATFDDGGSSGSVTVTLTALNLVNKEFVRKWMFNLDPALNPADLVFSNPNKVGSFTDPEISTGSNEFQAAGNGRYDILFEFANAPPPRRFGPASSITYTVTGIATLTADSFNFVSTPGGGNGPFVTAAHVQGIGNSGQDSGWISPEPASMLMLTAGSLVLLLRRRC